MYIHSSSCYDISKKMSSITFQKTIESILNECQECHSQSDSIVRAIHSVIQQYNKFEDLMPDFSICAHDRIKFVGEAIMLTTKHNTNWGKVVAMISFSVAALQTIDEDYRRVATSTLSSYIAKSVGVNWFIDHGGKKGLVEFCDTILSKSNVTFSVFLLPAILTVIILIGTLLIK
ncbi:orf 16; bcl-2 family member [Ateline gammaherpesvirus 3]|uniref:Orf 16 n=1 Tax=Ateline herpesvirus 3 TaxID=85618 RepID=Q9YTQ0_ATHV3|nr:orf 16; bcl-2 family member [Ateline gammaherpesvirus 3]AAC95540.1 orf 16; bcl-2 family member [Ateline gammaherpesvirus 3]